MNIKKNIFENLKINIKNENENKKYIFKVINVRCEFYIWKK